MSDNEIRNLVARYSDAVVRRDAETWSRTWSRDGEWRVLPEPVRGREAVLALWQKLMSGVPFVMQLVHSGEIRVESSSGVGRWLLSEVARLPDGRGLLTLGVYHDEYVVEDGAWCFARRRFDVLYSGAPDLSSEPRVFPAELDRPL